MQESDKSKKHVPRRRLSDIHKVSKARQIISTYINNPLLSIRPMFESNLIVQTAKERK